MAVHTEVTNENLLNAVVQMPESEFNSFIEKAKKLRQNGETEKTVSPEEADLLHRINTIFSSEKRQRYNALYARFKTDDLTEKEYRELLELSNEFEMLNAERIRLIGELAELRGQTLDQVMDFFELKNSSDE